MGNENKSRKWVVKAIVAFVAILLVLTFFSNTIMNATIPKVVGKYASRGNLSFTNSATSVIEPANAVKIVTPKELEGRVIDKMAVGEWYYVIPGDVLMTLKDSENDENLEALEKELQDLTRERDYESMTPSNDTDYSAFDSSIRMAESALEEAETTLTQVQNKDATIEEAQQTINEYSPTVVSCEAEIESITGTIEDINREIDSVEHDLEIVESSINVYVTLGTPTPMPTPLPGEMPSSSVDMDVMHRPPEKHSLRPDEITPNPTPDTTPDPTPDTTPEPTPDTTPEPTPDTTPDPTPDITPDPTPDTTPDPTPDTTPDPTPTAEAVPTVVPGSMEDLVIQRGDLEEELRNLNAQLEGANQRLTDSSSQLSEANGYIEEAQGIIAEANALPSLSAAQTAVEQAESELSHARKTLGDQKANDSVQSMRNRDSKKDRDEKISKLEEEIEKIKTSSKIKEIKTEVGGYAYKVNVSEGDALEKDQTMMVIIPDDAEYTIKFSFSADAVNGLSVGSVLQTNDYYVDKCIVKNIRLDPSDPRGTRIVECDLIGYYELYAGTSVTAVADKSNQDYDTIIASSAVNEDNGGKFVYVIDQSSTPLGDKSVVRRVAVEVEREDGSRSAIKGDGLSNDTMIVVRSEKPLNDGDRVRLEDYSKSK